MENLWLLFVVVGQFLNAIVVLFDKRILSKAVSKPIVYTFYVTALSGFVLIMVPFGLVSIPSQTLILLSVVSAISYTLSIYFLYEALHISTPSEVAPVAGAVSAISTFLFSFLVLGDLLPTNFFLGFGLLVIGMLLISHFQLTKKSFLLTILAGIFFGFSVVIIKSIFNLEESFADGFFWSRMANVLVALGMLLWPSNLKAILEDSRHGSGAKGKLLILNTKLLAGLAFLCTLIAIKLGHVALVSALTSLQYVFLLIFAFIFTTKMRNYFSEKDHKGELLHKLAATALIVIGFLVLFI